MWATIIKHSWTVKWMMTYVPRHFITYDRRIYNVCNLFVIPLMINSKAWSRLVSKQIISYRKIFFDLLYQRNFRIKIYQFQNISIFESYRRVLKNDLFYYSLSRVAATHSQFVHVLVMTYGSLLLLIRRVRLWICLLFYRAATCDPSLTSSISMIVCSAKLNSRGA